MDLIAQQKRRSNGNKNADLENARENATSMKQII